MSVIGLLTIILTFNFLSICEPAGYDRFDVVEKRTNGVQACGTLLADILSRTCAGIYKQGAKRDPTKSETVIQDPEYYDSYEPYPYVIAANPYRSKRSVASLLRGSPSKRKPFGVIDACCKKLCTWDELRQYCG